MSLPSSRSVAADGRFDVRAAPRCYSLPEFQPHASYKLAPQTPIYDARALPGAPLFHTRLVAEPTPHPIFHFAVARTYKIWGECPLPPGSISTDHISDQQIVSKAQQKKLQKLVVYMYFNSIHYYCLWLLGLLKWLCSQTVSVPCEFIVLFVERCSSLPCRTAIYSIVTPTHNEKHQYELILLYIIALYDCIFWC